MWITGAIAVPRIVAVTEKVRDTHLASFCSHYPQLRDALRVYRPWVSCRRGIESFLSALCEDRMPQTFRSIGAGSNEGRWSLSELSFLARSLRGAAQEPLGAVRKEALAWDVLCENEEKIRNFSRRVREAMGLLRSLGDDYTQRMEALILEVVPVIGLPHCTTWRPEGVGMSSHAYFGGVFLGLPRAAEHAWLHLAMNLAHEMGHQALMAYQMADDILASDHDVPVYSAVRQTPRPAILSFHALVAIVSMLEFARRAADSSLLNPSERAAMSEWERKLSNDLKDGLTALQVVTPTEMGRAILDEAYAALA